MWTEGKAEGGGSRTGVVHKLLLCTGDMLHLDTLVQDQWWLVQLLLWSLRGVSRVILVNNPLSGALILAALVWASPWQALLGAVGVLVSTLTAVITGQDRGQVRGGLHGFNGMLVSLLIGHFSAEEEWYWLLLLPVCVCSATSELLASSLSSVLDRWDLPVSVFPFNMIILLFLLCTGPQHLYFPRVSVLPPGLLPPGLLPPGLLPPGAAEANITELSIIQVLRGVPVGVGQIYACSSLGPSLLMLGAVLLYSPLLAAHALLGSAIGTLAGLSMAVRPSCLYSGLSGFNGALGCMAVGGLFFTFSWRTHLFSIASAFFSAYMDIALSNLLGTMGLPACSWAATIVTTLMMLMTGTLNTYRIPIGQVGSPELNLRSHSQWEASKPEPDLRSHSQWEASIPTDRESTDV
ncbi:unnamed protein product [Knipowitschia caucasica]|uniref:Urea transporter n=1 Tax=Knipowitschia caucasica TaxID=637954 RepID=A0AAV2KQK4_KNICA